MNKPMTHKKNMEKIVFSTDNQRNFLIKLAIRQEIVNKLFCMHSSLSAVISEGENWATHYKTNYNS